MIDKIKLFIAKVLLNKYLPLQYIVKGWVFLSGYRSQILAALWLVAFELHKYNISFFADPDVSTKILDSLAAGTTATLLEKGKKYLPYLDQGIEAVKTQGGISK